MMVMVQFTVREELKALPILLRHSPGMGLPDRKYVIDATAAEVLRKAGVRFKTLTSESKEPSLRGVSVHDRI